MRVMGELSDRLLTWQYRRIVSDLIMTCFLFPGARGDTPRISSVPDLLFLTCRIRFKTKIRVFKVYWLCRIPLI
jgi:hypothetical protein